MTTFLSRHVIIYVWSDDRQLIRESTCRHLGSHTFFLWTSIPASEEADCYVSCFLQANSPGLFTSLVEKINSSKLTIRFHGGALSPAVLRSCGKRIRALLRMTAIWKCRVNNLKSRTRVSHHWHIDQRDFCWYFEILQTDALWKVNVSDLSFTVLNVKAKQFGDFDRENNKRQCLHLFLLHIESALNWKRHN